MTRPAQISRSQSRNAHACQSSAQRSTQSRAPCCRDRTIHPRAPSLSPENTICGGGVRSCAAAAPAHLQGRAGSGGRIYTVRRAEYWTWSGGSQKTINGRQSRNIP
eukprot:CAMPEP_0173291840 /NCGR_PEP_ID=MMETSP1143-20121109/12387_1 /TAXON_ID=483371 /ORGANISM="non described non described, Strain CCMP2298" /LENGTH=105 /DNA_ID=CAMNT_0014231143 /DNA_START=221 /DNA_END=534 /DNA_ORIENTATION=+